MQADDSHGASMEGFLLKFESKCEVEQTWAVYSLSKHPACCNHKKAVAPRRNLHVMLTQMSSRFMRTADCPITNRAVSHDSLVLL